LKKILLSSFGVLWGALALAGNPIGLEVWGVPQGTAPVLAERLHTALLYASTEPVTTGPATRQWFWQPVPDDRHIRVVFTHYYSGEKHKVVLPMVSARYSYQLTAEGTAAVYSPEGDSLVFRSPFRFRFERPVSYQVVGENSDLPSAKMSAKTQYLLECEALDSLTGVLVRLLEAGGPSTRSQP
jgi:hypothetical protein